MRIFKNQTVYEAAIERINWLFDEFPNVAVAVSGCKDSSVIFELTLQVARERNRLPLDVMFTDQEGEWASTIEMIRYMMYHPDVKPFWLQVPIVLFNATSTEQPWLECWNEDAEDLWVHPRDPIAITENVYGTVRFKDLFDKFLAVEYADRRTAFIGGVRAEESPNRATALTDQVTYKWATWGRIVSKKLGHYVFYPLYDWAYSDVWKAIHANNWKYSTHYDKLYQYGVHVRDMRVSNLHHETAVQNLFFLQEFEPETYARLTGRLQGIDTAGKLGETNDFFVSSLPFMFSSWREYRDYLLENLITNPDWRRRLEKMFEQNDRDLGEETGNEKYRREIQSILTNDWEGAKMANYQANIKNRALRKRRRKERKEQRDLEVANV